MANSLQTIPNDVFVAGNLRAQTMQLPAACVGDASVLALAGVQASKLQHQYQQHYAQTFASNATVARAVLHVVKGATGALVDFSVGATTAGTGTATVTVDLLKNGATVLSSTVSLTSATAAFVTVAGALASLPLVAGDVLEINVSAVSAGTGALAKGLFARLALREDAQ